MAHVTRRGMTLSPPVVARCIASTAAMKPTSLLFAGQGAQRVGMAQALSPGAQRRADRMYDEASSVLGYDLGAVVRDGPPSTLTQTTYAQPALLVAGLAAVEQLKHDSPEYLPRCHATAGVSLGEYCALAFAGALTFGDAVRLVGIRATAMQAAADAVEGRMATVVGLDDRELEIVCAEAAAATGEHCSVSNFLFPRGRVIAGASSAVDAAWGLVKGKYGRRVVIRGLEVSGAFHTPLMQPAVEALRAAVTATTLALPTVTVYANATGEPYTSTAEIREGLVQQLTSPVLWEQTITNSRFFVDYFPSTPQGVQNCFILYVELLPRFPLTLILRVQIRRAHDVP